MKKFIQGMYQKKNFGVRLTAVILSVIVMGFALSLLVLVDLGTDPCTSMNLAISEKIGMGIGNWQALLNTIIFVFVILLGRENIGFGTLANMFLVGYSLQFFSWVWDKILPAGLFDSMAVRILVLYGYASVGKMTLDDAMKELELSCEATRDLYLFMLSIVMPLTDEAKHRIDLAKNKFNPTEEDLNPNTKFADNQVAEILRNDPDFKKMLERKNLSWSQYDLLIGSVLDSLKGKKYFQNYMAEPSRSLKEDCRLFIKIFEKEFVDNPQLAAILEDISLYWIDDLAYSLTFCCRTMEDLAAGKAWRLPDLYMSDILRKKNPEADVQSDKVFVTRLLKNAFTGYEGYYSLITSSVKGWEADRLNSIDISIVALGLAEAESFPEIPLKVTINEYVEISKYYSSPKSCSFVNGLLDKLCAKLVADGKIVKSGAGLVE